ncbi:hypothetical protein NDU88_005576 [Pleurodeles waltl]|uniref:Uncharacterized protein n=1 Tax=Pleurodeles waltl TaxID=8319 RepID=A0AAV7PKT0_PLEWA|nr:hypothetical protein NDU88_005576 [Pleurodeles waltl]
MCACRTAHSPHVVLQGRSAVWSSAEGEAACSFPLLRAPFRPRQKADGAPGHGRFLSERRWARLTDQGAARYLPVQPSARLAAHFLNAFSNGAPSHSPRLIMFPLPGPSIGRIGTWLRCGVDDSPLVATVKCQEGRPKA